MITPTHYMLLSAALFIIGVIGVMVRRNIIIIFMSIELILNAVNINGLVGIRSFSRKTAGFVACAMMTGALGLALFAFWQLLGLPPDERAYDVIVMQWIPKIPLATTHGFGNFEVPWGFRLDPLSG